LESAVPSGTDPREHAKVLARVHAAAFSGEQPPTRPRAVIEASWRRLIDRVDPDTGGSTEPLTPEALERRREASGLLEALPTLRAGLVEIADQALHIMVVVGADGRVLWRDGSTAVRRKADGLGFVDGARWDENTVGTNAIGTALVARRPVQVYASEHFVRTHHVWTCAAAPVHDPRSGRLLGVVDVSGPASTVHATTLALVDAVARLAQTQLRGNHQAELARLRAVGAPLLARIQGRAVVADPNGWIAAAIGVAPVDRILLPERVDGEWVWLPAYGSCRVEPLPGGWLIRLADDDGEPAVATRVQLDLRAGRHSRLVVESPSGQWAQSLSPRHAEMLLVLATSPAGRTAIELATDLFGDVGRTVTVRAEMSRLRRHLAGVLDHRPYRFADWVDVTVLWPEHRAQLLPCSTSPAVIHLRGFAPAGLNPV
jgi:GAF domain